MFEEADKIKINDFEGWYDRGEEDSVLPPYLVSAQNVVYEDKEVKTREPYSLDVTYPTAFDFTTAIQRVIDVSNMDYIYADNAGHLKLQDTGATILTATIEKIAGITAFGRPYILVYDGIAATELYTGSTTSLRKACGAAPTGATLAAVTSGAGNVERGTHVFKVVYETDTGYFTAPGNTQFAAYAAAANDSVDLSGIPTGPSGTLNRHIIVTRSILNYNNDHVNQEYFFLPGGEIAGNVTTTLSNISFYDADLVDSADFLLNQLSEVDFGTTGDAVDVFGVHLYNESRLVCWAGKTLWISNPKEPESFDSLHGSITIDISTGRITDVFDLRGSLYICTTNKTYITTDNGDFPDTWEVICMDHVNGALSEGVGYAYEQSGGTIDFVAIANYNGIMYFNGAYQYELTEKIRDKWRAQTFPDTCRGKRVVIDHYLKRIYALYSEDASDATRYVICGDYSRGMTADKIRWSKLVFTSEAAVNENKVYQIWTEWKPNARPDFKFIMKVNPSTDIEQYKLDKTASQDVFGNIESYVEFLFDPRNNIVNHFVGFIANLVGSGTLASTLYKKNRASNTALANKTLAATPTGDVVLKCNAVSEKVILKISCNAATARFSLRQITGFFNRLWMRGA